MVDYQQDNIPERPPRRRFWQNFYTEESGEIRKILMLSSLVLSFLLLIIHVTSYILLMPLLEKVFGGAPRLVATLAEAVIPALIAVGAVMLCWPLFKDKRVLPAAYVWLSLFALVIFIGVVIKLKNDPEARNMFMFVFSWDAVPSLLIGNLAAWRKYLRFIDR